MLKRILCISVFLASALAALPGRSAPLPDAQRLFDQANGLYARHEYDSAQRIYQKLVTSGFDNPELFYNAGNASFKARHLGYAVYYYEKALQQSPGNAVVAHNLAIAREEATDKIDQIPTLFFVRWWHHMLYLHSPGGWVAGSIITCWILVFFIGWRRVSPTRPRWTRWALIASAVLCGFYLAGAFGSWYRETHRDFAVVIQTNEPVKATPDAGSQEITTIHEGLKVRVTDEINGWRKIRMTDGKEGWIKASSILTL